MEKIVERSLLYDFYGELLTQHQRAVYEDYVFNDIGISEIAGEQGISRQSVHDLVRRCDGILHDYEKRLGLLARFEDIKKSIAAIDGRLSDLGERVCSDGKYDRDISAIRSMLKEMADKL